MKMIAIIPARGGSKRIPRKNILPFAGRPLISYSIEAALGAGIFDEVMVSTDDREIADTAGEYGASVPFFRSGEASGDMATTNDVLLEVLSEYEKRGKTFDAACCIYPTAPFLTGEKLRSAASVFEGSDADTMISVMKFSYPPQRAYVMSGEYIEFAHPEYALSRSQDLPVMYHDAGQFYFFRVPAFQGNKSLFGNKILPFELPETQAQDIDTEEDFRLAEMKFKLLHG